MACFDYFEKDLSHYQLFNNSIDGEFSKFEIHVYFPYLKCAVM